MTAHAREQSASSRSSSSAAVFTCTFAEGAVERRRLDLPGRPAPCGGFLLFYALDRLGRGGRPRAAHGCRCCSLFLAAFLLVYLIGFFNLETAQALDQFVKGLVKWLLHFGFLIVGVDLPRAQAARLLLAHARAGSSAGSPSTASTGSCSCCPRRPATTSTQSCWTPLTARREPDQHLRRGQRLERLPAERADRRPEPPRDRAAAADPDPLADLPAARARPPAADAAGGADRLPAARGAGDALAQRPARPDRSGRSCC